MAALQRQLEEMKASQTSYPQRSESMFVPTILPGSLPEDSRMERPGTVTVDFNSFQNDYFSSVQAPAINQSITEQSIQQEKKQSKKSSDSSN